MRLNSWINDIHRLFIPRPNKEDNKRFDMAERTISFPQVYFDNFLKTVVQEDFITYPSYAEYNNLKDIIAEYNGLNRDNVYLSTGSGACIKSLCEITISSGYNMVSPVPSYPMYGIYTKIFGGSHIGVEYDGSTIFPLEKLINSINDKTRLVIVSNPLSPIGEFKTVDQLRVVCDICNKRGIIFLIDEAYVDFSPGTALSLLNEYNNVVISRTFSKAFGAAGIRVGYLLGSPGFIKTVTKVQMTYPLTGLSVKFASYLIKNICEVKKYVRQTVNDRDLLCDFLENQGYDVVRSHTNSIHFHESTGDNSHAINKLRTAGLAFKSGNKKTGTPVRVPGDSRATWIRLSVGPGINTIVESIL